MIDGKRTTSELLELAQRVRADASRVIADIRAARQESEEQRRRAAAMRERCRALRLSLRPS